MARLFQMAFSLSIIALCWLGMMAVHELGHVMGALVTGGSVERVVLHPLTISRTDVSPNPVPAVVVWLGPIVGSLLPLAFVFVAYHGSLLRRVLIFFAGFCLLANGAYISMGSFAGIGDCREMISTGTPIWVMISFGAVTVPCGLLMWHRTGSIKQYLKTPDSITPRVASVTAIVLVAVVAIELVFSRIG